MQEKPEEKQSEFLQQLDKEMYEECERLLAWHSKLNLYDKERSIYKHAFLAGVSFGQKMSRKNREKAICSNK